VAIVAVPWAAADEAEQQRADRSDYSPAIAEERIEQTLERPLRTPLAFVETPLNQVLEQVKKEYEIPIVFDTAALEATALSPDVEVTIDVGNVSLRSALDLMLRQVEGMTYMIDKEVLQITTKDEAAQRLQTIVYRVDDLVRVEDSSSVASPESYDFDPLIDILVSSVDKDGWQVNGTGEGEMHPYPPGMLVVTNTPVVHTRLERLLTDMRRVKGDIEASGSGIRTAEAKPITRGIPLKTEAVGDSDANRELVRNAIVKSVDWGGADDEGTDMFLYVLPERVLVRHQPHVVRQVELVMANMGAQAEQKPSGGGRGGF